MSAYWITPQGKVIEVNTFHIATIVSHPSEFGETKDSLKDTFDKHGEHINTNVEGKAREEIMMRVMKRGFVRIRKMGSRNDQRWSIQLNKMTTKINDALWMWSKEVEGDKYANVTFHFLYSNKIIKSSLDKISSGSSIVRECLSESIQLFKIYSESEYFGQKDFSEFSIAG